MTDLRLSARFRWWALGLAQFGGFSAIGMWTDPAAYSAPIFDNVRAIAPLWLWGAVWAVVCVAGTVAVITLRVWAWRTATSGAVATASMWLLALTWGHWVQHDRLTLTTWSLWAWFTVSNITASTSRHQFVRGDG